jgi:hypothetical protein
MYHVDQINKIDNVTSEIHSKNDAVQEFVVNNVTRQLHVLSENISNTTRLECDKYDVITRNITELTGFIIYRDVMVMKQIHDVIGNYSHSVSDVKITSNQG